mmetsp:Transcript_80578/g.215100  ORF Transcript_80578/g.215100 Transcript_80578/m.215100 type:complete len:309 (-) Transcript_80578:150-1076(-)
MCARSAVRRLSAHLTAAIDLNYSAGARGPRFVCNPFEGDGWSQNVAAGAIVSHFHEVADLREVSTEAHNSKELVRHRGFGLVQHESRVAEFTRDADVRSTYYPELVDLAKRITGASRAAVASHALRRAGPVRTNAAEGAVRGGAFLVHNDFSDGLLDQFRHMHAQGAPSILSQGLGLSADDVATGSVVILNVWRPLATVERAPLAICDPGSIASDDVLIYEHRPKELPSVYLFPLPILLTLPSSNPGHRWYYYSRMTPQECLVFKTFDSRGSIPHNGVGVHSAFDVPGTPDDAPSRESIEARVVCFVE